MARVSGTKSASSLIAAARLELTEVKSAKMDMRRIDSVNGKFDTPHEIQPSQFAPRLQKM
jgi:hypothetical protein